MVGSCAELEGRTKFVKPLRVTSGGTSESSSTPAGTALSPTLGAAPRSTADAPEAASGVSSADSQRQSSVSGSGASGDGTCAAADAPEASSALSGASRFSSVRWEDIQDIVSAGTDRTVQQVRVHLEPFLGLGPLGGRLEPSATPPHRLRARLAPRDGWAPLRSQRGSREPQAAQAQLADAARPHVATNIALEQSSHAAAVLEQRCRCLDKSLGDTHKVIRQDRENFKAGIASYATQVRQQREYLERSERQSSVSGGAGSASKSTMPAAFATFLEELGVLQLVIPAPPATSGSSEASVPTTPASSETLGGATATSGSSTALTVDSDTSNDSDPVIPLHSTNARASDQPSRPPSPNPRLCRPRSSSGLVALPRA
ncbi:unnamed protein product [Phytophthora fragariaefolia]|uniref:Unnamed protein product n=1 Tax=Phytophthora fragariaefolia TaxID=1490495 RepID=A0A9W7CRV8_9STRA|nr:unnamed protein product [Phytophthora fragariaefolia]